jgi:heme-degrading monooxygenase HmoA
MVVIVFRSRLESEHAEEFGRVADRMLELAREAPGFVSYKSFTAEDGERVSLVEFESREAARRWGEHPEHREAQTAGRDRFYAQYTLQVCTPARTAEFKRR